MWDFQQPVETTYYCYTFFSGALTTYTEIVSGFPLYTLQLEKADGQRDGTANGD